jgi:tetratricopeptide (TPR) repeat protein
MYLWIFLIALFFQNVLFIPNITEMLVLMFLFVLGQSRSQPKGKFIYILPLGIFFILGLVVQYLWLQVICAFFLGRSQDLHEEFDFSPNISQFPHHIYTYVLGIVSMFMIQNTPSFLVEQINIFFIIGALFLSFTKKDHTSTGILLPFVILCFVGLTFFPKWSLVIPFIAILFSCNSPLSRLVFLFALLWYQFAKEMSGILQFLLFFLPLVFSFAFWEDSKNEKKQNFFFQSITLFFFLLFSPTSQKMSFLVNSDQNLEIQFQNTSSKIISTPSFDILERQAALLVHRFLPTQSQITIRGDWFFNVSSVFVDDHVVYYDVPDPQITNLIVKNNAQSKKILSHVNFHVQDSLSQYPSYTQNVFFDILHSDRVLGNHFASNKAQRYWMKQFQLSDDGLYVALIHLSHVQNVSCMLSDLQKSFQHHQVWFLPNSFDAILFVGSEHSLDHFFYPPQKENTKKQTVITSNQRISIFKQLAFTKNISVQQCPLFVWNENVTISYPILDLILYVDQFPDIGYLPENERYAIQLQREDVLMNLKAFEASKQGNLQKAFSIASKSKNNEILINPHLKNAKIAIKKAKRGSMDSADWNEALRHAQTAHMLSPNSDLPKILLAEIAIGQGYVDKAKEWYQQVLDKDDKNMKAIDGMARIAGLENHPEDVEKWLKKAFSINPEDPSRSHNLGYFYLQRRQLDVADSYLRTSLQKNPESIETQLAISELYLFREEYARARITIDRIHQTKNSGLSWFLRGRAHFGLMEYKTAEEDFRRAILADPKMDGARGAIGNCRIALGDLEGAAQAYRSALHFNSNNKAAKDNLIKVEQELSRLSTEKQDNP